MFDDLAQASDPAAADEAGDIRLAAVAKHNAKGCRHLVARVRHSLRDPYERWRTVFGRRSVVSRTKVRRAAAQSTLMSQWPNMDRFVGEHVIGRKRETT